MGAVSLQPVSSSDQFSLSPLFTKSPPKDSSPAQKPNPAPVENSQVLDQFEQVTYSRQVQRMSLMARFQEISAQLEASGEEGAASAQVQARQLEFNFFAESRSEELTLFRERSQQVAEGLEGAQRSSYLQTTQQVAARFEFSMSMSGAALGGFANAGEALQGNQEVLDQFLGFTQQVMAAADDFMNELLGAFSGNVVDNTQFSFEDLFQRMINEFLNTAIPKDKASGQGGSGASAQFAAVQLEFNFSFSGEITVQQGQVQQSDPIMFDLDGDGFELSHFSRGAQFDILGSGEEVQVGFVEGGDAFLALDRNGDGVINSGKELFGDQLGARNGYEELRKLDSNADGVINDGDDAYAKLQVWRDNGNGATEAGELVGLKEAGIAEISLNYRNVDQITSGNNRLGQIGAYRRTDGSYGKAADAILNFRA